MSSTERRPDHPGPARAGARARLSARLSVVGPGDAGLGADALALPGEHALLLRVALPLASHRQRQAAIAFAVEDSLAEPIERTHVVLGPELSPGEYLAIAVRHETMSTWAAKATAARARLAPDVLGLPVPPEAGISVLETGGRVLVRRADGTGFATGLENFEAFWRADGTPQIVLFGGRLATGIPISATGLMPAVPTPEAARLDLLQGRYARTQGGHRRIATRLAAVLALALLAHGAILAAETVALGRIAETREAEMRAALTDRVPGLPATAPIDVALRRALPQAGPSGGGLLPLLAQVSEALEPMAGEIALRTLAWSAADMSLAVTLEAADLATLQRVEAALAAARLGVASGVATTGDGAAEVRTVITGAPA